MTDNAENRQELTSVPPPDAADASSGDAKPSADFTLDQATLDALLAADALEEAEGESAHLDEMLTNENELDSIIQEQATGLTPPPTAASADTAQFFDASALESLLDDNTVLGPGNASAPPTAAPPETVDTPPSDTTQDEVADLLQTPGMESPLADIDFDAPIINAEQAPLVQETPLPPVEQSVSPDVINSLVAAAHPEETYARDTRLAQHNLDTAAGQAVQDRTRVEPAPAAAAAESPESGEQTIEAEPPQRRFEKRGIRWPEPVTRYFERNFLKMLTTLAAATVAAMGAYTYLYVNQERLPDTAAIDTLATSELSTAMADAQRLLAEGAYTQADQKLQLVLATARDDERVEVEYLLARALYLEMVARPSSDKITLALDRVNALLDARPEDPRAVDLLRWKAYLFSRQGIPLETASLYGELIDRAAGHAELDVMLIEAANAAMTAGRPADAARYLERLLRDHAGSPVARNAKLLLGQAYAAAGRADDAAAAFEAVAQSGQDTLTGAEAAASLAQLAIDQGRPDDAIRQLEGRVASATSVQGNDRVYLALARAYRATGRTAEARDTLNDVINFFPESDITPAVHLEMCRTLEDLAQPDRALQAARQAARRYPNDRQILSYLARLLAHQGQYQEAATFRLAANDAGQQDPELLLAAARDFRAAGEYGKAAEQYRRLLGEFPRYPQAFEGNIELCETLFDQEQVTEAIDRLENLAAATPEGPRQLPVLAALSRLYSTLGIPERTVAVSKKMTEQSSEPAVLARAAINMMQSGAWDEGIAIAARVDLTRLDGKTAAALLTKHGEGLLMSNPRQSVEILEKAYNQYPEHRSPQLEEMLLKAWLASANTQGPDALVAALESSVAGGKKEDAPRLVKAATLCGNDAFARGDNARAAEMFGKILKMPEAPPEAAWAKYQRANALMRLASFEESAALFDEVAATNAPYAEDAQMKAGVARIEQRLGWKPATAKPPTEAQIPQGTDSAPPRAG